VLFKKRVIDVPKRQAKIQPKARGAAENRNQKWVKHVNQNPRNAMTYSKAQLILQESIKKRR
jgi:hypothetical protein